MLTTRSNSAYPPCPVCQDFPETMTMDVRNPCTTYAEVGRFSILRCSKCGYGLTWPQPSSSELHSIYTQTYGYDAHVLISREKRWRSRRLLKSTGELRGRSLLDIGCMQGYLLEEARAMGASEILGIELNTLAANKARKKGFKVHDGTLQSFRLTTEQTVDRVVVQHVLEHVEDVNQFFSEAHRVLTTDGYLILCAPHFGSFLQRTLGDAWGWYQVPVHLHHFSRESLRVCAKKAGFEILRTSTQGGDTLFLLMTILNCFARPKQRVQSLGWLRRTLVRAASNVLRYFACLGDDELIVILRKIPT